MQIRPHNLIILNSLRTHHSVLLVYILTFRNKYDIIYIENKKRGIDIMLILTRLNKTIEKARQKRKEELFRAFLTSRAKIEEGIENIATQGEQEGEIVIYTDFIMTTSEIEEMLSSHYKPIRFCVTDNCTNAGKKPYFIADVIIPEVDPDDIYGYDIIKGE